MSDAEIAKVKDGVVLLPVAAGEIVLSYNLESVPELKLPRSVYPRIFSGEISHWRHPDIVRANPDALLPDQSITVVVRSDSSGTTYVYTSHLSKVDSVFNDRIGIGKSPQWPKLGSFVKSPKNDGVTATIKQTPGAIGYIEWGFAKLTGASTALLENKAGKYVAAGSESGTSALATAKFPEKSLPSSRVPDLRAWIVDPEGDKSYPITSFTWLMFPKNQEPEKASLSRRLVEYCITEGQKVAEEMGYIPLPRNVTNIVREVSQYIR